MKKKLIVVQVFLLLSHGAFAQGQRPSKIPVTCQNYKEANIENPANSYFVVNGHEVDCSIESDVDISYTAKIERISLIQFQEQEPDRSYLEYYPVRPDHLDEISQLESLLSSFIKQDDLLPHDNRLMLRAALPPKLPNMSYEEMIAEIEGASCLSDKNKWPAPGIITNFRNWSYVEHDAFSKKIWFITDCKNQPAKLYIKTGDAVSTYTLPVIDHEFAYTSEYDSIAKVEYGLKDINPDGETFSIERIDHVNYAYVTQDIIPYDIVVSQLTVDIFKNNKVYTIPQQRMISTDDNAFSRLSADGHRVVIASNYALKLYEYQEAKDKFVLVGRYKYDQENYINEASLQVSNDGLEAFIKSRYYLGTDYEETYHKITFSPVENANTLSIEGAS